MGLRIALAVFFERSRSFSRDRCVRFPSLDLKNRGGVFGEAWLRRRRTTFRAMISSLRFLSLSKLLVAPGAGAGVLLDYPKPSNPANPHQPMAIEVEAPKF